MKKQIQQLIYDFIDVVKSKSPEIAIEEEDLQMFNQFIEDAEFEEKFSKIIEGRISRVMDKQNLTINEDQQIPFFLFSAFMRWKRVVQEENEPLIYGGFAFNGGRNILKATSKFWQISHDEFLQYGELSKKETDLLHQLSWFESPTRNDHSEALYTPYSGCVLVNSKTFPNDFYFYDGGISYALPFKNYEEYITALLANAGVEYWQYFYIKPKLLVSKNKGVNYMTTQLRHNTLLVEDLNGYSYDPSLKIDRLDLILEYLKWCVRYLPKSFPSIDFTHQQEYLKRLEKLV